MTREDLTVKEQRQAMKNAVSISQNAVLEVNKEINQLNKLKEEVELAKKKVKIELVPKQSAALIPKSESISLDTAKGIESGTSESIKEQ